MNKPVIIDGEASETDSEEDLPIKKTKAVMTQSVQGAVVTGEDSESENENDASICSAVSALNLNQSLNDSKTDKYDSLFRQKLREHNVKLYSDIQTLSKNTIDEAEKSLNAIDQQLLRSQLTLQSAVTSLKSLGMHSTKLKNKLHSMLTAKFIPNINLDK